MNPAFREGRTEDEKIVDILRSASRGLPKSVLRTAANIYHPSIDRIIARLLEDGLITAIPAPKRGGHARFLYVTSPKGAELLLEVRDQERQLPRSERIYQTWDVTVFSKTWGK